MGWGYNWGSTSDDLSSSYEYVPMLWGTDSTFTDAWDAAVAASGATYLMSFNEPDESSQADLSPSEAAAAYLTYMEPYAGTYKLGAPAVTNGGGSMGLDWLSAFLDECSTCTIDFVAIHWYSTSSESANFQEQVTNASTISGGLPVWVTEFGCTDTDDTAIAAFLADVLPWMDEQDSVARYAYFMAADGYLNSGTELSTLGSAYASTS